MSTFADVPEFFEVELAESLLSRTESLGSSKSLSRKTLVLLLELASFRELGPPDLCHVIKTTGRAGTKDVGQKYSNNKYLPKLRAVGVVPLCFRS